MITNVYDIEAAIVAHMGTLFDPSRIIPEEQEKNFNNKIFHGLTDAESVALLVLYNGFDPHSGSSKGVNLAQQLYFKFRLVIIAPRDLYRVNCGAKFVEVVDRMKSLDVDGCMDFKITKDNFDNHLPVYSNNMVGLPILYEFLMIT